MADDWGNNFFNDLYKENEMLTLDKAKKIDKLANRASCMNRVHDFINIVVPPVIEEIAKGFKLTNDSQLYSKDKDRIQAVLDNAARRGKLSQGHSGARGSSARLRSDDYNIKLEVSDNYPVKYHGDGSGSYSCEYYNITVYLWNHRDSKAEDFKEMPMTNAEEMHAASEKLKAIESQISDLQSERYPLQRLIGR